MISEGDILTLTVDKPAAGGRMIARADGLVVLVSGAIPGERVRATIERVGKGVAHAAAIDIEQPSGDRRPRVGDPLCGGCLYAHITYPRQLELKALVVADAFARIGRLELPAAVQVAPSPEEGYRMRAAPRARPPGRLLSRRDARRLRSGRHANCCRRPPMRSIGLSRRRTRSPLTASGKSSSPRIAMPRSASCTSTSQCRQASPGALGTLE